MARHQIQDVQICPQTDQTIKTRQFIDYEEAKIKKVGGQFDMKELIELVNDFETSHNEVPTEDFTIVYCEASGEPAQWANDLQLRQKAIRQNKICKITQNTLQTS